MKTERVFRADKTARSTLSFFVIIDKMAKHYYYRTVKKKTLNNK